MSKKLRFLTEYAIYYFKKYILLIVLGIVIGSFTYIQRNHLNQIYQSINPPAINVGIVGLYTTQNLPSNITSHLSYGFTTVEENEKAVISPLISEYAVQDNNTSYIFNFKDNLTWQNGKKFKPADIVLNIPGTKITPKGDHQLEIKTEGSFAPLLSILSKPLFIKNSLIGMEGDYKASTITYQDGYVKRLYLTSTTNNKQNITYHFYPNNQDLFNAFKLGEVDEITSDTLEDTFSQWPNIKISQSIATNRYLGLFINTEKLNNKQIRQAIAYATPKSTDKNKRCLGPISPNSWAYNPEIKEYNNNTTRAKELFENNKLDHLNLIVTDRKLLNTAEDIKTNWEKTFNIKVNLTIENQQVNLSEYETVLTYGSIPTDPDQYSFWQSTQTNTNITHLNNSRIDKLLEEGRQIHDQVERKKIYYDFQKFLLEESPVVFLEFPTTYIISRVK